MNCKRQQYYANILSIAYGYRLPNKSIMSRTSYKARGIGSTGRSPKAKSLSCCGLFGSSNASNASKVKFNEVINREESHLQDGDFDNITTISSGSALSKKMCACSSIRAQRRGRLLHFFTVVTEVFLVSLKTFPTACVQMIKEGYSGTFQKSGNVAHSLDLTNKLSFCCVVTITEMVTQLIFIVFKLALLAIDSLMLLLHLMTGLYCDTRNWWKKKRAKRYDIPLTGSESRKSVKIVPSKAPKI